MWIRQYLVRHMHSPVPARSHRLVAPLTVVPCSPSALYLSGRTLTTSSALFAVKRVLKKKKERTAQPAASPSVLESRPSSVADTSPLPPSSSAPPQHRAHTSIIKDADITDGEDDQQQQQLVRRLEKVNAMAHQLERSLRVCSEATGLAQRQLNVLDRRLLALEQTLEAMQTREATTQRTMGEVMLQQRNVELLVRQMEQRVLNEDTASPAYSQETVKDCAQLADQKVSGGQAAKKPEDGEDEDEGEVEDTEVVMGEEELRAQISKLVEEAVQKALAAMPAAPSSRPAVATAGTASRSEDVVQLAQRVEQLSLQHLALQRVLPAVVDAAAADTSASAGRGSAALVAEVAAVLHREGSRSWHDVTGAARGQSQKIVLRNVPRNISASEVRAVCAAKLGAGHSGRVISCVVAQHPLPASLTSAATSTGDISPHTPEREAARLPSAASLAQVPIVDNSKTFEIVFDTAETARRALVELNRTALKPAAHLPSQRLIAEPAVSADFLGALADVTARDKTR